MDTLIFCISVNTSPITAIMLHSFHKYHPDKDIVVFGIPSDFKSLQQRTNTKFIDISNNIDLMHKFQQGHAGTTYIFAQVLAGYYGDYENVIHIDSDIYFKKESISAIEQGFKEGYAIVGTRRCYGNNPSGIANLAQYPDTISTFFFGIKRATIPNYTFDNLYKYCSGAAHPLGWIVLDCFDGVTHGVLNNGGSIKFLGQDEFGSQNESGKKANKYPSNMHLDMGEKIAHFGGVGSGYAYLSGYTSPDQGYGRWAIGRWALFSKLFYGKVVEHNEATVYGPDGRWINGNYDDAILQQVLKDLLN